MRYILTGLILIALSSCFVRRTFSGQILSIVDSLPIPGNYLWVDDKRLIPSDSLGVFTFSTAKRKVRLTIFPATIHRVDTVISLKMLATPIKLFSSVPIDSTLALFDIKHNRAQLFCGGGIAPLGPRPFDKDFEANYSIKYQLLDCLMPSFTELNAYNKVVADYLDKKYGVVWRHKVRPDVFYVTRKG